jgi:peptide/nickel transport system permease protein
MYKLETALKTIRVRLMKNRVWELERSDRIFFFSGLVIVSTIIFCAVFADILSPFSPYEIHADAVNVPPGSFPYILGTDAIGRDVLSRAFYGARISLLIGLVAVALATIFGATLGVLMGYFGGAIDRIITLPMDALYSFPSFLTVLLIVTTLGGGLFFTAIAVAIGLLPKFYRTIRSSSISLKEEEFIEAEKSLGANDYYIIFKHIYPLCISVLVVVFTVSVATSILSIAGLGFLGLGVAAPIPEWGTDLNAGRPYILSGIWWTTMVPATLIFLTVFGFNLVGEGLNKIFGAALEEI